MGNILLDDELAVLYHAYLVLECSWVLCNKLLVEDVSLFYQAGLFWIAIVYLQLQRGVGPGGAFFVCGFLSVAVLRGERRPVVD